MPKIDIEKLSIRMGSGYPAPFDEPCLARQGVDLGTEAGLTHFGAKLITLPSGAWSSQRHWHSHEDELVYIISGTPTFLDDAGEQLLSPGDMTAHPGGDGNGHHMINRTDDDVTFLVIGTRAPEKDSGWCGWLLSSAFRFAIMQLLSITANHRSHPNAYYHNRIRLSQKHFSSPRRDR